MKDTSLIGDLGFQALINAVVDYAIYMLDADGKVVSWNSGAQRIKQYEAAEIIGRHYSTFYTPEDAAQGMPNVALSTARTTGRYEAEGWRVRKDGTRFWASVVIDAVRDDQGRIVGFAKITRDVTERRDALLRLEETREQLFQTQKLEALGQLTGGVAHDFNNLLTAILGAAELARRAAGDNQRLLGLLSGITASAQRGAVVTQQLLEFARQQPLEPELVELPVRMHSITSLLRHSLRGDIGIVTELPGDLWPIQVDIGQLELAMLNVALNARDAMPLGGTLRIVATNVSLNREVEGLAGEFVALSVVDSGLGIAAEVLPRIFDAFYTTKDNGRGTGLGLSQVRRFVTRSNGAVTARSLPGQGTTITLYLPAQRPGGPRPVEFAEATGKPRILVVEDDMLVAEYAAELLHEMGYATRVVHNGSEALVALQRDPGFDLVFSDIVMPGGINGVELAERIGSLHPQLPILLTSGYNENAKAEAMACPIVPKPYRFDDLQSALSKLLERRVS